MAPESAPTSGTIAGDQRISIIFLYTRVFNVTYEPNGGTGGSVVQHLEGSPYTILTMEAASVILPVVSPYVFVFLGWGRTPAERPPFFQPGDSVMLTSDLTVYAIFDVYG
jgi:hypothetical protein